MVSGGPVMAYMQMIFSVNTCMEINISISYSLINRLMSRRHAVWHAVSAAITPTVRNAETKAVPSGKNASPITAAKTGGLNGCWECGEFPCNNPMFDKPRVRAFISFVTEYGEDRLLDCLARNEAAGMAYHYDGRITGDYDIPETEVDIKRLILRGK